jgi:alkylated DNA repair dioxygenase AlkB
MLKGDLLDFLGYYSYDRANSPDSKPDNQVPNTPALHDDPAMRTLLYYFLYDMTEYAGVSLEPTYSYLRVYKNGDVLHKHTDKKACEYSVSITLKREQADDIWPLCLETGEVHKVCLEEGDGLIYKGVENPHWRDKFEGERLAQVFLHYVRR